MFVGNPLRPGPGIGPSVRTVRAPGNERQTVDSSTITPVPRAPSELSKSWLVNGLRIVFLATSYALVSWAGQRLAYLPPGNILPVFPASGVALAGVLAWGWPVAPAVLLGSLLANGQM